MNIDIEFVRSQFPAFSEPSLEGQAFFENAGGSYMCKQVIKRFNDYYIKRKVHQEKNQISRKIFQKDQNHLVGILKN